MKNVFFWSVFFLNSIAFSKSLFCKLYVVQGSQIEKIGNQIHRADFLIPPYAQIIEIPLNQMGYGKVSNIINGQMVKIDVTPKIKNRGLDLRASISYPLNMTVLDTELVFDGEPNNYTAGPRHQIVQKLTVFKHGSYRNGDLGISSRFNRFLVLRDYYGKYPFYPEAFNTETIKASYKFIREGSIRSDLLMFIGIQSSCGLSRLL